MQIESPPTDKRYEKPEGERRGLVIVHTGDGKGKSQAALGVVLRTIGLGICEQRRTRVLRPGSVACWALVGKRPAGSAMSKKL